MSKPDETKMVFSDIAPFMWEMHHEYERHYPEKGESWKIMSLSGLDTLLDIAYEEYKETVNNKPNQLIDIANLCAFIYIRLTEPIELPEGNH